MQAWPSTQKKPRVVTVRRFKDKYPSFIHEYISIERIQRNIPKIVCVFFCLPTIWLLWGTIIFFEIKLPSFLTTFLFYVNSLNCFILYINLVRSSNFFKFWITGRPPKTFSTLPLTLWPFVFAHMRKLEVKRKGAFLFLCILMSVHKKTKKMVAHHDYWLIWDKNLAGTKYFQGS